MRRNYISPEFQYNPVFGSLSMEEESTFFGSKMLEIEDFLKIGNENIIYFQNQFNEQLDLEKEYDFPAIVYDLNEDKQKNHTIVLDELQNQIDRNGYAKWIMKINIKEILRNYLFAILKNARTFEGIRNTMTFNQNIDISIRDYIERNVINRYKFSSLDLYLVPVDLLSTGTLKYNVIWDTEISIEEYRFTKFSTKTDFNFNDIEVFFSQNYLATQYTFRYYYNLNFEKL